MKSGIISIRRHFKSDKQGVNATNPERPLALEGKLAAADTGSKLEMPEGGMVGYHSPRLRAYQSLIGVMYGAQQRILPGENVFEDERLDAMNFDPEYKEKASYDQDGQKKKLNELCDHMVFHPDESGKSETPKNIVVKLIDFMKYLGGVIEEEAEEGKPGLYECLTHEPHLSIVASQLTGAKSVYDFGGAFKEGENILIEVDVKKSCLVYAVSFRDVKNIALNLGNK